MKKGILVLWLLAIGFFTFGQTNQNNANPYGSHPFDKNPFNDQNQGSNNFLRDQELNQDNTPDKKEKETKKSDTKDNKEKELNDFKDLNEGDLFKNDPEYLKYLNSQNPELQDFQKEEITDKEKKVKEELDSTQIANNKLKSKIYGANFFMNNVFDLSDKVGTAPPMDYRLGPGDELIISLWGGAELQTRYTISNDGSIFPIRAGKINLNGLTFDEARDLIISRFRKIVPPSTQIDVQMGKSRLIRVTIEGEVEKPGTYSISAFNTAINALFKAGGLTTLGNMRRIEVKRQGRTVEVIDLYEYLQKGKSAQEVYLEDNDYLYVDIYDKLVQAQGYFKRPMYYQLMDEEGLYDLMDLAGGPSFNARRSQIQIKTIYQEEEHYINISGEKILDKNSMDDYVLKDGDVVTLKPVNTGLKNIVKIEGAVNYPDEYEVRNGDRLSDIIERAGGLKGDVYLSKAFLFRGDKQLEANAIKIDLRTLDTEGKNNIQIERGDRIKILSFTGMEEKYQISVRGFVRRPGDFPFYKNLKLKDLLLLAGGLTLDAENGRIEIANVVDSIDRYSITNKSGTTIQIVNINSNLEIDEVSENIVIKPMDRIYVRRRVEFLPMEKIFVRGEINYPGEYVLSKRNEPLSSIVKRSGGLSESAYGNGAKLFRKGVGTIVIDLPAALANPNSIYDIGLMDSDILVIPTVNDIVSIRGEVQNKVNVKFEKSKTNIKEYISAAGGYGDEPWKNRINVKYQNGKIKSTKSFMGVRIYPKIKEGCLITVPKKPIKENKTKFSEILTYTLSTLTTLATLVVLARTLKS